MFCRLLPVLCSPHYACAGFLGKTISKGPASRRRNPKCSIIQTTKTLSRLIACFIGLFRLRANILQNCEARSKMMKQYGTTSLILVLKAGKSVDPLPHPRDLQRWDLDILFALGLVTLANQVTYPFANCEDKEIVQVFDCVIISCGAKTQSTAILVLRYFVFDLNPI